MGICDRKSCCHHIRLLNSLLSPWDEIGFRTLRQQYFTPRINAWTSEETLSFIMPLDSNSAG